MRSLVQPNTNHQSFICPKFEYCNINYGLTKSNNTMPNYTKKLPGNFRECEYHKIFDEQSSGPSTSTRIMIGNSGGKFSDASRN